MKTRASFVLVEIALVCAAVQTARPAEPPQNCVWRNATAMLIPIMDQAVAALGNNLYSFSGVSTGALVANSYKFNGKVWTPIANYPVATEWPTAVSDGSQFLYIMNGVSTGPVYQTTLYRYDPVANTYTQMASNTVGTWNQAAVYLNGKIYKMGGYNSAGAGQTALEIYTVSTNTWALGAPIPVGVGFPSAWASGNFIYYFGGITTVGQLTAFRYDVAANTWTATTNLPATRWGAASAVYGDGGVVAGGYVGGDTAANISNTALYSDGTMLPNSLQQRARMSGAVLGNSFYYIGGRANGDTSFNGTRENQELTCSFQPTPVVTAAGSTIQMEGCSPGNGVIDPGEPVTVSFCVQNTGNLATTNLVGTLSASGGVTDPSGPQTYGALSPGGPAVCRSFTFTANSALPCGGTLTAMIQFQDGTTNLGNVTSDFVLGTSAVAVSENFDGVTPPALPSGWTADQGQNVGGFPMWVTSNSGTPAPPADSAPNAAFSVDPTNILDNRLNSPMLTYPSGAQLTFRHNYNLEQQNATTAYDAGVLEMKIGAGDWQDILIAGGTFVTGGYNHATIGTGFGSPIMPHPNWSGISNGGAGGFETCIVNLPAAGAGQPVQFRWRMGSDSSVSRAGWRVDSVTILEPVCCSSGAPQPSSAVSRKTHGAGGPTFDVALPLTGTPGIECRTSGGTNDYTMVVSFGSPVTINGTPQSQVISGIGTIGIGGVSNGGMVTISGNDVIVPLTNVTNAQTIQVRLNNVTGTSGSGNVTIPMSVLIGDTNANAAVNSGDVSQTKARLGAALDTTNFRSDVNANGAINAGDVSQIKSLLGTGLQ